ncbi:MAG: accessory Sec system translocase SecA2, partial [Mycobacterium sp.]|nr:accessory Sec system translocase SecA2 [Mycobacterium sp.]
ASITFQNYFRMYDKLSGMTGTAATEKEEFFRIYNLDVVEIPTNVPVVRDDQPDQVYKSQRAKFNAAMDEIEAAYNRGQPVLVGTSAIETSEYVSRLLKRRGIEFNVLNAKNHEREAVIIAQAGRPSAVTIATNMAGRGTDIMLGEGVVDRGGLHIIGTERHESRRVDNQLRGRAGRQGDPGSTVFFSSWEDDVVVSHLEPNKLPLDCDEDGRVVHPKAASLLEHAQRIAEGRLLDVHANTWRYNQLIAQQRAILVERRDTLLRTTTARDELAELSPDRYAELCEQLGSDAEEKLATICRLIMLYHLDRGWADHLDFLADIRESIHLRALGRQNPLDEFHRLAVDAFASLAADAIEAAQQTFDTAPSIEDEPGVDLSKLARPTSTWTYMVHDNPLSDESMSALSLPGVFR